MKIRYIGNSDPTEHTKTTAFGHTFVQDQWVDLPKEAERLAKNPMFEVQDEAEPKHRGRKPHEDAPSQA